MMKKILIVFIAVCLSLTLLGVSADDSVYNESSIYAQLADKVGGCEYIGAFVEYKDLVDRNLNHLSSMNSAERQQLVTDILTSAGAVYVNGDVIDFTDGELNQYLTYAVVNAAEAKNYLKYFGMSSIADVPLIIDFGSQDVSTVKLFKSFLANAYNSGFSSILIRNKEVGFVLDMEDLATVLTEPAFEVSLIKREVADFNYEYQNAMKSQSVYQFILAEDNERYDVLPNSKVVFYNTSEDGRIYCFSSDTTGVKSKFVSSDYDGVNASAYINSRRWFGVYSSESLATKFSDVPADHWAYEYIDHLAANGIVSGSDGKFNPESYVTREEFVKILVDAFELQTLDAAAAFEDVTKDKWFYKYVATAHQCGIVSGVDENTFGVGKSVSRQDIAVMTMRAFDYKQIPPEPVLTHFGYFFDSETISDYAQDAVMTMYVCGFISGDEDYRFNPHLPATRAEVAKIIYMIVDYMERT